MITVQLALVSKITLKSCSQPFSSSVKINWAVKMCYASVSCNDQNKYPAYPHTSLPLIIYPSLMYSGSYILTTRFGAFADAGSPTPERLLNSLLSPPRLLDSSVLR